ncbi:MAG: hypothetical protein JJU00_16720 [Opitutales bacterium]|nr:hypothetical protein [Opitutales bacterium]
MMLRLQAGFSAALAMGLCAFTAAASGQTTTSGTLLWDQFVQNPHDHSHIPNVSYAGYRRGEAPVPEVPVVTNVMDFGAMADGTGDNSRAFREAIDAAWYAGGGAVFIPEGTYRIEQIILLHRDGVVLRGAGKGQTVLHFANPLLEALGSTGPGTQQWNWTGGLLWIGPRDLFEVTQDGRWQHNRSGAPDFFPGDWELWHNQGTITSVTSTANRGESTVTVEDADDLAPGDLVLMTWENPPDDALWREIVQHAAFEGYDFGSSLGHPRPFAWPVEIASVSGDEVTLAQPIRVSIKSEYNTRMRRIGNHVRESGVEHLTIDLPNDRVTYNYNDGLGWNGIFFNRAYNSWARGIEILNGENGIHLSASKNVSILDIGIHNTVQSKYIFTSRAQAHDILYDGFVATSTSTRTDNGISTEWLSTGNVWTRGDMGTGTFDCHRLISFDFVRTDITMVNPSHSRPGGAATAGPFVGRRGVHWNVRISGSDRPEGQEGEWVYHPVQYTYGAQIGIQGAPPYTANNSNPWAMPPGDKAMLVGDDGVVPHPANLFDAQRQLRADTDSWVDLTWPTVGFLPKTNPILRAHANAAADRSIAAVQFHANGQWIGTATEAPYSFGWANATPGRHEIEVELVDSTGHSTWSRPYSVVVGKRLRVEQDDTALAYSDVTSVINHPEFSAGQGRAVYAAGNSVEITFRGTRVRWFTRHNNHAQNVTVTLNGVHVAGPVVHGGTTYYRYLGWDSGELPEGEYVLRMSASNYVLLDHLEVISTEADEEPEIENFASWRADHFTETELEDPEISGAHADPTGQGMTHLERYAFGLGPFENVGTSRPAAAVVEAGTERYFGLTFLRDTAAPKVEITPQASTNLVDWDAYPGHLVFAGDPQPTERPGVVRETVYVDLPMESLTEPVLLRLQVTELP